MNDWLRFFLGIIYVQHRPDMNYWQVVNFWLVRLPCNGIHQEEKTQVTAISHVGHQWLMINRRSHASTGNHLPRLFRLLQDYRKKKANLHQIWREAQTNY